MSIRSDIVDALVVLFKDINGTGIYTSNLYSNVKNGLEFLDEVKDWPYVFVYAGDETREYLPSGLKWRWLTIPIKIYVSTEYPVIQLENILEDLELVLDANNDLEYTPGRFLTDIRILSITTDQGILAPLGIGELVLQIQYEI